MTNVSRDQAAPALPPEPAGGESVAMESSAVSTASRTIEMAGLEKSFGSIHAVRGIGLTIAPGEVVALLGPNGAGKSTTLDMLLGLTEPDRGSVALLGQSPHEAITTGTVGAMLQTGGLIRDLDVRELLVMMASLYPHPMDVDELLELSGAQTQRVRFAMALVSDPDVLVLDEPTVAMDVKTRQTFWASMRTIGERAKTVVFATHYLEEADLYADRVVLMAQGRVVADGSTTTIKAMVGSRTIAATLPGADPVRLGRVPGVTRVEIRGETVTFTCSDSDTALRTLIAAHPDMHAIEVKGAGLEAAFLELTADDSREDS